MSETIRKDKYYMILPTLPTFTDRKQNSGYNGLGGWGMHNENLIGTEFPFGKMKTFSR